MKAVVLQGPRELEIVEKSVPLPGPGEVLVRISYCGICGSDLHAFESGFLSPGMTIGHEFSGVVASAGDDGDRWVPGEYVTGNNIIGCGGCRSCRKGLDNLCLEMRRLGITEEGTMAEYALVPAKTLVKLPGNLSLEQAALAEPLSVGLHAVHRARAGPGDNCLILGAGTIGLVVLALLRHSGVENVSVVEPDPGRRAVAGGMGAAALIDPRVDPVERAVDRLSGAGGPDLLFDCAGLPETIEAACSLGSPGARAVVLGICHRPVSLNFLNLVTREISIETAFGKTMGEFREAAALIAGGHIDLMPLITGIVSVADVAGAFGEPPAGT